MVNEPKKRSITSKLVANVLTELGIPFSDPTAEGPVIHQR